ncbi:WD40/YVTN repeat-like containing protein [Gracilaria domingensis]|nr:WD40/YVTN repeat-like containing protein [Gracilaria domingensis]
MVAEPRLANAFAIVGLIPEDHGFRTVAEYRGRLITVPPRVQRRPQQDEDTDAIAPADDRSASASDTLDSSRNGFLEVSDSVSEVDDVLRDLARQIDVAAVATGPHLDRICALNFATSTWEATGERVPQLAGTRCIAFRPYAGRSLAIGCEAGVILMEGHRMIRLCEGTHRQVLSLDWSPDGTKLAASSKEDGSVRIWDVATRRSAYVGRGAMVKFSPGGVQPYLFVASANTADFLLWSCDTWKHEKWGSLSGPVGESAIHVMKVAQSSGSETRVVHSEITTLPSEGPGGTPILLEIDPTGERLAVAYDVPRIHKSDLQSLCTLRSCPQFS